MKIFAFLEIVVANEIIDLKDNYDFEGIAMVDNPSQLYLFASKAGTKAIAVNGLLPLTDDFFKTAVEKEFLKFHVFIKEWTTNVYDDYVRSLSNEE